MRIIRVIFVLMVIIVLPIMAYADWASDYFNDMKNNSSLRQSATIQAQGSATYSGGGWTWEGGNATLQPFQVKAPSVSAGCSGISFDFGAFSFLADEKKLIAFLEQLLAAAPGYAFELAMQILCPSCLDIMNTMNQIANTINGLQFDACGTLKQLGNLATTAASTYAHDSLGSGKNNYFNNAMDEYVNEPLKILNEVLEKSFACLSGSPGCPIDLFQSKKSLQQLLVENLDSNIRQNALSILDIQNNDELTGLLSAVAGDLVVLDPSDNDQGAVLMPINPHYKISNSEAGLKNAHAFIMEITYGMKDIPSNISEVKNTAPFETFWYNIENGKINQKNPLAEKTVTITITPTQVRANNELDILKTAFAGRGQSLSDDTLAFLASFKTPVYKILNIYSVEQSALNQFINSFRVLAGAQMTYEIMSAIFSDLGNAITKMKSQVIAGGMDIGRFNREIDLIMMRYGAIQAAAYDMYVEAYDKFYKQMQDTNYLQDLQKMQRAMMARHPVVGQKSFVPSLGM